MKVIVCGAGQVGFNIARYLASEQNDVTVIDQSAELIGKVSDLLDVQAIAGHASHPEILEQSGFVNIEIGARCDTFGGATGEDKARLFDVYGYPFLAHKPA